MTAPPREAITGLVLCGGLGRRMGGVEKALLPWMGGTLLHAVLARLEPQVAAVALNANRAFDRYAAFGRPIWRDETTAQLGPLAGWLAGLQRAPTEWLLSVPCDTPRFPADLAARLAATVGRAPLAIAATADGPQPVFALLHRRLAAPLAAALALGERGVARFAHAQGAAVVVFDDAPAFADADTPDDLARLQPAAG
ncbi:MAG: molybdenum cofactor guanylyltransferase [Ideonella sp. WA131b]|jgi:molybdopterin-guanine dinucleotide biosynthesis protein A|nr:molybdenum cofactor guanylyltransferase [Ideonella sp. WA131b]